MEPCLLMYCFCHLGMIICKHQYYNSFSDSGFRSFVCGNLLFPLRCSVILQSRVKLFQMDSRPENSGDLCWEMRKERFLLRLRSFNLTTDKTVCEGWGVIPGTADCTAKRPTFFHALSQGCVWTCCCCCYRNGF